MRFKKNNLLSIFLYVISFYLFVYSFKFFMFLIISRLYNYLLFLKSLNHIPIELHNKLIKDYPLVIYYMNIGSILIFIFALVITIVLAYIKKTYDFIFILIIVIALWVFNILKFSSFKFYDIFPKRIFKEDGLILYLVSNWLIFLCISFFMYYLWIRTTKTKPTI